MCRFCCSSRPNFRHGDDCYTGNHKCRLCYRPDHPRRHPRSKNPARSLLYYWGSTTPFWTSVIYTGVGGSPPTIAPTVALPTPPRSIGSGAPAPPTGSWPKRAIQPFVGAADRPWVNECQYFDFLCVDDGWIYGNGTDIGSDPDKYDENWQELLAICPTDATSSSTSTTPTITISASPLPSPSETGDPMGNAVGCYNGGENTEHTRMDAAASSFCYQIGAPGTVLDQSYFHEIKVDFDYNGGIGTVEIVVSLEIKPDCDWPWNYDECRKYLNVPVDSCNCGGVDGKQGGTVENNCYKWRIDPNVIFNYYN